jgi:predicted DsbA family dithiol-disulfide isomerase
LEARFGADWHERLFAMFDAAGLPHADRYERIPNSKRALVLGEIARSAGVFATVHSALFTAHWVEGRDIGSDDVLLDIAASAGLEAPSLDDPALLRVIEESTAGALSAGASGVPAWAIDQRILVPGAQPHELFERVMEKLGHAAVEGS